MNTWFLLIFLYTPPGTADADYIEKIAIPMSEPMAQSCTKDKDGIVRYNRKIEGMDRYKVFTVCVTEKHWRGLDK